MRSLLYPTLLLSSLIACTSPASDADTSDVPAATLVKDSGWNDYWYAGDAEINSYALTQTRYGEQRTGDATLIFVTEPFSGKKQVKLDDPDQADDKVSVLKLNAVRKFPTGIYDYSMMTSVFTPVSLDQHPHTLKATCTSQEWCGQSFTQLNHEGGKYRVRQYSYFESEGDEDRKVEDVLLEDELFTRLRIDPKSIPTGTVELIPNLFHGRFSHDPIRPKQARIKLQQGTDTNQLIVEYLHVDRTLIVDVSNTFPYTIEGWEEQGKRGASKATLRKRIKTAYWGQNANKYEALRDSLQFVF